EKETASTASSDIAECRRSATCRRTHRRLEAHRHKELLRLLFVTYTLYLEMFRYQLEVFVVVDASKRGGGDRVEMLLRVNRRALAVLMLLIVFLGATAIAIALWPDIWLGEWPLRFPLLFPIAVLLAFFCLRFLGK